MRLKRGRPPAVIKKYLVPALAALCLWCSCESKTMDEAADGVSAATRRKGPTVRALLARYMPEAMADSIVKIAVLQNVDAGDRLFLEGCVSEGRSLGFTVDSFAINGDIRRCRELVERLSAADYDGLVLYYGSAGSINDCSAFAAAKGLKIVTFDAQPFKEGGSGDRAPGVGATPGITGTAQDDEALARISLDDLLARFPTPKSHTEPVKRPVRVIRIWPGPGFLSQERRKAVFDEYVREGKISEAAVIGPEGPGPADSSFARNGTRDALAALLPGFPPGSVDAIWAPHDEFARGCVDALAVAGRTDIKLVSIDISSDDIHLMLDNTAVWLSTAAVDPHLAGVINMRLLAAKLAGESTPDAYTFGVQIIESASLNRAVSMANLSLMVPGWGREAGLFDHYPWMTELKTAESRYLRIAPVAAGYIEITK